MKTTAVQLISRWLGLTDRLADLERRILTLEMRSYEEWLVTQRPMTLGEARDAIANR
jgi:hypothetical protein